MLRKCPCGEITYGAMLELMLLKSESEIDWDAPGDVGIRATGSDLGFVHLSAAGYIEQIEFSGNSANEIAITESSNQINQDSTLNCEYQPKEEETKQDKCQQLNEYSLPENFEKDRTSRQIVRKQLHISSRFSHRNFKNGDPSKRGFDDFLVVVDDSQVLQRLDALKITIKLFPKYENFPSPPSLPHFHPIF